LVHVEGVLLNIEVLKGLQDELFQECRRILEERGEEYNLGEDTLESFKKAAVLCGLKPSEVCFVLLCLKAVRLRCASDPWDSCVDLVNYATLYLALLEEEEDEGVGE
jgi:hypothetical protein